MKTRIAALLLCVYIIGNTEAGQVLAFPNLFKHYQEHRQQNASMDFLTFLVLHYSTSHGARDKSHQRLPFQNQSHNSLSVIFSPMIADYPPLGSGDVLRMTYADFLTGRIPLNFKPMLLRPPQLIS